MRQIVSTLIVLLITIKGFSQEKEVVNYKAVYKVDSKVNKPNIIDDSCVLTISKSFSYFYSLGNQAFKQNLINSNNLSDFNGGQFPTCKTCFKNMFLKKYSSKKVYKISKLIGDNYAYPIDSLVNVVWSLQQDSLLINNYNCYKAIGKLDTLTIVAWYCPTIPLQDGPGFFRNLPGLILRCNISNGLSFNLLSLSKNTNISEENKLDFVYQFTTLKDFLKVEKALREQANSGQSLPILNGTGTIKKEN